MPRGFSLDASFTIDRSSSPISRASSEIGLPGWYGAIERTYEGESSHRSINMRMPPLSVCGRRVRSQDLEIRREPLQLAERPGHRLVLLVAFDVDEEYVFPQRGPDLRNSARGTRFDARHADAVLRERSEQRVHRARPVLGRHDERRAVPAGRARLEVA